MAATIRSASLANYADVARQVGLDPFRMLRRCGIDVQALNDREMRVPALRVADLLELSAAKAGCPDFGMRMAESRKLSDLGAVSLLISHQTTLRDVLDTMGRYRNLLNSSLAMHIEQVGEFIDVKEELVIDGEGPRMQSYQLAVGVLARLFRSILGPQWHPYAAHFTQAKPASITIYRRLFGDHIEFESDFNGLTCHMSDLDTPNLAADPSLARYAAQFVDTLHDASHTTVAHETRKAIYLLLPLGGASIERIARSLGLHERTLQRRLSAEGAEFSKLINDIRRELAERYLANRSYSLSRIAEMLGYGQLSSFTRWFSGEFGEAPGIWRNRDRARNPV